MSECARKTACHSVCCVFCVCVSEFVSRERLCLYGERDVGERETECVFERERVCMCLRERESVCVYVRTRV